jgi:hypothetical protein
VSLRDARGTGRLALHQDAGISSAYNDLAVLNRIYLRHVDVYRYGIDSARVRTRDPLYAAGGGWRLCQRVPPGMLEQVLSWVPQGSPKIELH